MNNVKPRAIVFGAGNGYIFHYEYIHEFFDIIALIDNCKEKQGTICNGIKIESPDIIGECDFDYIIITPVNEASLEIKTQLENMGIERSKLRFNGGGIAPFRINPRFFENNLSDEAKEKLFSENVERVLIEINSKCNRKCWFCANSLLDKDIDFDMSDEIFDKVLNELAKIHYEQEICLSFMNEPLLCTKLIERVKKIKCYLPKCFLYVVTNGDYLNKQLLGNLEQAGLDLIMIDIYTKSMDYSIDEAFSIAEIIKQKLDLPVKLNKKEFMMGFGIYKNMDIEILSQDFSKRASNRAESLPESLPIPKITSHPAPCIKNFISFHIDFRGDVWPCPNYHRELKQHREYCLGNVREETIFDIYLGEKMSAYRERNFFHRDSLPCRSCIWDFQTFISNRFHHPFRERPMQR